MSSRPVYYSVKDWPIVVSGKVSLIGQEQGLRARILKLAYIRDVGIGTSISLYCAYYRNIIDNDYPDYLSGLSSYSM